MFQWEKKILEWIEDKIAYIMLAAIALAGLVIRFSLFDFISSDMSGFLLSWYEQIIQLGRFRALNTQVGNYSVLYQTLIAIMTYIPVNPVYQYKFLSVIFDYVLGISIARYVWEETDRNLAKATVAFAMVILSPIVFMNSAMWGQCDAIYSSFLVLTLIFFQKEKYNRGFIMYGLAFSFKLQAVFLLPLLLFVYLRRKNFSALRFLIVPVVMEVMCIPAMIMGRGFKAAFSVYYYQTGSCDKLYFNYPSFWSLYTETLDGQLVSVSYLKLACVILTVFLLGMMMFYLIRKDVKMEGDNVLFAGFLFVFTCVMFLPGMHDRYGFPFEMLAIPICFKEKKTIPLAIGLLLVLLPVYGHLLVGGDESGTVLGVANTLIYLAYTAILMKRMTGAKDCPVEA